MQTSTSVADPLSALVSRVLYEVSSGVACITMDSPPVNGLNLALRSGLIEAFKRADSDRRVRAVVLTGAGRGFSAGGDIKEFGTDSATADPALSLHVHPVIEAMSKPVIASLHGIAIGGGLETALACHYRVAETNTKIGLPEVTLGTFPLSGTQRLPRLLGLQATLELILSGRITVAEQFPALFDELVGPGQGLTAALALADRVGVACPVLPLVRHLHVPPDHVQHPSLCAPGTSPSQAQRYAMVAIGMAIDAENFDSGLARARVLFNELMTTDRVSEARERFFSVRTVEATKA